MKALTETQVLALLRKKYGPPEYAFLPHVRNGTGYSKSVHRTADALSLSLWPSRGLHLHGFEVKSHRGDWLREKENPEKAEEIAKYCDFWWLVLGKSDVALLDEVPTTWGLLAPNERGTELQVVKPAQLMPALPLDKSQMAAIIRKAAENTISKEEVRATLKVERERLEEQFEARVQHSAERMNREYVDLVTKVKEFETAAGVSIRHAWDLGNVGAAVNILRSGGLGQFEERLLGLHRTATEIAAELATLLQTIKKDLP